MGLVPAHKRVVIIMPYFGIQPKWFNYFIQSCAKNPQIDWLFFSDTLSCERPYKNLFFQSFTLQDFNQLASKQLGLSIQVSHPYKICDFRPAFGKIFAGYIQEYNYWGYGDLDLVYGRIDKFLPFTEISKYDIISNHTEFIPGHLCILKNQQQIIDLYSLSLDYKDVFQSSKYHGFDEIIQLVKVSQKAFFFDFTQRLRLDYHLVIDFLIRKIRNTKLSKIYKKRRQRVGSKIKQILMKDFTSIVKNHVLFGDIKVKYKITYQCDLMFKKEGIKNWTIEWNNGKLINGNTKQEIMYFHFFLAKHKKKFTIRETNFLGNRFFISSHGIKEKK